MFSTIKISINTLKPPSSVLPTALEYAKELVEKCSPDSVQTTKRALILAEDSNRSVLEAAWSAESNGLFVEGENLKVTRFFFTPVDASLMYYGNAGGLESLCGSEFHIFLT